MTTVAIYHRSIPNQKNQEKIDLLRFFAEGVRAIGDIAIDVHDNTKHTADVGMIQGWITEQVDRPHLHLRKNVIEYQRQLNARVLTADSNLFLYADDKNPHHYLRYSFDGVFPDTGEYFDADPDPARWRKIASTMNIALRDWRSNGNHILLCLQRNQGWSMGDQHPVDWAARVILEIRKWSDRPIRIRPHPGDKKARDYIGDLSGSRELKRVTVSNPGSSLLSDLRDCWAAVNHNSSPVVGAAIEGVPIFVTDSVRSQSRDIANLDFSQIENPTLFDRQPWVERISMSHWNFAELRSGQAWAHIRQYVRRG